MKPTVYLVEDNQDNADLICDLLGFDYDLRCFSEATSVLAALEQEPALPQLLLLDISLPGMDGATLLRHIRSSERLKHLPAIALTAHAMKSTKESLLAMGFDAYVSKPITEEEVLFEAIKALIH